MAVVMVSIEVPICAVNSWEARLRTGEEEGDSGKAVAAATQSSSASDKSQLEDIVTAC